MLRLPAPSPFDKLAQETIDEIIDFVPHDTLEACTLVSRRWLSRSRARLFRSFTFPPDSALLQLLEIGTYETYAPLIDSFIDEMHDSIIQPSLFSLVRILIVNFTGGRARDIEDMFYEHGIFTKLTFTGLESFYLCVGHRDDRSTEFTSKIAETNRNLNHIAFDRAFFIPEDFLCAFSSISNAATQLQSLTFIAPNMCKPRAGLLPASFPPIQNPPRLKTLTLIREETEDIFPDAINMLFETPRFFDLSSLNTLILGECWDVEAFGKIAMNWGSSITCLQLQPRHARKSFGLLARDSVRSQNSPSTRTQVHRLVSQRSSTILPVSGQSEGV
ncbi:hypothetical protein VKT23_016054 [Stygiomarasmius scandens]|uniref:F-box domain-containing protein n=1 Tax=Marasmiellus scandens TaxID=2682957 RepID=A0ABR1J025_9AGAR